MTIPGSANPLLLRSASTAYTISRSLRFNSSDSAYLSRTPSSAGNRKTWTWAGWVKLGGVGTVRQIFTSRTSGSPYALFYIFSDDKISFADNNLNTHTTAAVYRDPSAWYHIQLTVDTTDATAANRVRLWINGSLQTWASTTAPTQNTDGQINTATAHSIGSPQPYAASEYFSGYLADIHFIDGQALTPSSFGEFDTNNVWQPKAYSGSYGTNGFHLDFADNSAATATTLGKDTSGLGNNWTPNNFSVTAGAGNDSLVDSPTNYGTDTGVGGEVRGNYCTWNPLNSQLGTGSVSNGNLDFTGPSGSAAYNFIGGTFGIDTSTSTGWYFEITQATYGNGACIALLDQSFQASALWNQVPIGYQSSTNSSAGISYRNDGYMWNYGTETSGLTTWQTSGDTIGVAIKDNKIWFAKNNAWISGSPSAGTSPSITLASTKYVTPAAIGINSNVFSLNAGQRPFAYAAPSGFKALCTANLPEGTITTSGTFTGNANADGPFIWLNGVPTAMTINSNAVTFGTHADKLANGFKLRTNSTSYNTSGSNTYSVTTTGDKFKNARAQANP